MKSLIIALTICLMTVSYVYAQDLDVSLKQGFIYTWNEQQVKNLTTLEVAKSKRVDSWGSWNALWEGWTLDIGFAYDNTTSRVGALVIGREFGTIGKYLPIDFPLKDKISITLYPVGIYVKDLFNHPEFEWCSGVGIIKLEIKF